MTGRVLLDTGPIVAILSATDEHHDGCVEQLRALRGPLVTCWPVLTEAAWLLRKHPAAVTGLLALFEEGPFQIADLNATDIPAVTAILNRYAKLGIQLADASLVHLGNREGIGTIFTLDRRDFSVLRLSRGKKLRIVP
jgi:hypothetical protein